MEIHNKERDQMERGQTICLLPTPRSIAHGSEEQAHYLLWHVKSDKCLVDAANGYREWKPPVTEEDKEKRADLQDKAGASVAVRNTAEVDLAAALGHLSSKGKPAQAGMHHTIQFNWCPFCRGETWLTMDKEGKAKHTCLAIRDLFFPILFAHWDDKLKNQPTAESMQDEESVDESPDVEMAHAEEGGQASQHGETSESGAAQAEAESEEEELRKQKKNMRDLLLTRSIPTGGVLPWTPGERLKADSPLWQEKPPVKPRDIRKVKKDHPLYVRVMDTRGRLDCGALKRDVLVYPFQLADKYPGKVTKAFWRSIKGVQAKQLRKFVKESAFKDEKGMVKKYESASAARDIGKSWLACPSTLEGEARDRHFLIQARAIIDNVKPAIKSPQFDVQEVQLACTQRVELDLLRPFYFDSETRIDILSAFDDINELDDGE